jgi:hypothetical protein
VKWVLKIVNKKEEFLFQAKNQPRSGGVKEPDFWEKAADANVGRGWIGIVVDSYRFQMGTAFKSYRVQTTPRH